MLGTVGIAEIEFVLRHIYTPQAMEVAIGIDGDGAAVKTKTYLGRGLLRKKADGKAAPRLEAHEADVVSVGHGVRFKTDADLQRVARGVGDDGDVLLVTSVGGVGFELLHLVAAAVGNYSAGDSGNEQVAAGVAIKEMFVHNCR